MDRGRLEAFSDGVFAIIITIMVLELPRPKGPKLEDLTKAPLPATFVAYVLSFIYVGIYWNNHHHLIKQVRKVTASIMWANLALLFFLTLLPFATGWFGEFHTETLPVFVYGLELFLAGMSYFILQTVIVVQQGGWNGPLGQALGRDLKGRGTFALLAVSLVVVRFSTSLAIAIYLSIAFIWFIPDRRLERALAAIDASEDGHSSS